MCRQAPRHAHAVLFTHIHPWCTQTQHTHPHKHRVNTHTHNTSVDLWDHSAILAQGHPEQRLQDGHSFKALRATSRISVDLHSTSSRVHTTPPRASCHCFTDEESDSGNLKQSPEATSREGQAGTDSLVSVTRFCSREKRAPSAYNWWVWGRIHASGEEWLVTRFVPQGWEENQAREESIGKRQTVEILFKCF